MASFLVWIIIIGVIVWSEVKKQQRRQGGTQPNMPGRQTWGSQGTQQNSQRVQQNYQRPQQARSYQGQGNQWAQTRQAGMDAMVKKQQELKARLEQRYGKPAAQQAGMQGNGQQRPGTQGAQRRGAQPGQGAQGRMAQPGDILSRAAANVRETENDQLEQEMSVKHAGGPMTRDAHDLVGAIDITETSELMRQVSDLMIMGYQADMTYERDFIAEGVEMLNSYELPTGI